MANIGSGKAKNNEGGVRIFYAIPAIATFSVVFALVPVIRAFAKRYGFVDRPNKRKIHDEPVPLMGGLAIYLGCIVFVFIFDGASPLSWSIFAGGTLLVAIGLVDDWYKSRGKEFAVWPRVIVYAIASTVPLWFGVHIEGLSGLYRSGMIIFPNWMMIGSTVIWIFALINMINFIDGVDGLASGIATISSLTLFVTALIRGQSGSATLAAVLIGACLAFLVYNFHPAEIFMGDAGAAFLGYTLAVIAIDGTLKKVTIASVVIPCLALAVPLLDTAIVFTRRLIKGTGLHHADKLHTHHTLMKWGLSQTQTVFFMYLIAGIFSLLSVIFLLIL